MKLIALTTTLLALPLAAQEVQVFGGNGEVRQAATKIAFDQQFNCLAQVCIQYGNPPWKDEYAAMTEAKNKNFRLGKNYWTTLNTANNLTIGGVEMPAGAYFLGLHTDRSGKMHLAAFEASASNRAGQGPWAPDNWTIDWVAPLEHKKVDAVAETLAINLLGNSLDEVTLQIHWGNHALTAPVSIQPMTKGAADASGDKGKGHDVDGDHGKGHDHDADKGKHGNDADEPKAPGIRRK